MEWLVHFLPHVLGFSVLGGLVALDVWASRREYRKADAEIPTSQGTAKEFLLAQVEPSAADRRRDAARESARIARGDLTQDREGYYGPLPDETPDQLVARLDRAAVLDWERRWEALAGYPWHRHDAVTHREQVIAWEEARQTKMLLAMKKNHFGDALARKFSQGGVLDMGSIELEVTWGKDKPRK